MNSYFAAHMGDFIGLKHAIEIDGYDINHKWQNRTILMEAVASCADLKMIEYAIEHGANLNLVDGSGFSALMLAIAAKRKDFASLLLFNGADVSIVSRHNGHTAIRLAADYGYDIFELQKKIGIKGSADLLDQTFLSILHKEDNKIVVIKDKVSLMGNVELERKEEEIGMERKEATFLQQLIKNVHNFDLFFTEIVLPMSYKIKI